MKSMKEIYGRRVQRTSRCAYHDKYGHQCNALVTPESGWCISSRRRGGEKAIAYCEEHWACIVHGYTEENHVWSGTPGNGRGVTSTFELECMWPDAFAYSELNQNKAIPTADSTVDCEFKLAIYYGLNSPVKLCPTIQQLINDGHMVIDDNCGTHFHIGLGEERVNSDGQKYWHCLINRETMGLLRCTDFYRPIVEPLANLLRERPDLCAEMFGRRLGYWASYPKWHNPEEHCNFINVQHDNTIEFRIMFFANSCQYARAIKLCGAMGEAIYHDFMAYNDDFRAGRLTTGDMLRKAEAVGQKLARLFNKYLAM